MCGLTLKWSHSIFNITLEYKINKTKENVDWEPCQSKYADILALLGGVYMLSNLKTRWKGNV